ncbi:MAG TPA: ATP-binding protein [Herpetosiphonaceae bacterium]
MTGQLSITRAAAVLGVVVRGRTYGSILYLVVAVPLGVIYLLLLGAALILDLAFMLLRALLLILATLLYSIIRLLIAILRLPVRGVAALIAGLGRRKVPEQPAVSNAEQAAQGWSPLAAAPRWIRQVIARWRWWIVLPALCWALATWERSLTVRWLEVDMPSIVRPRPDSAPAGSTAAFPWTFLGYLLAKLPFALVGGFLVGFAIEVLVLLKTRPVLPEGYTSTAIVAAVAIVIATLHGVNGLVRLWGRFAYAMIAMNDTVRRLRDAEQRAAQARASAERAEQSRRELIVNVSHELRTPIASIRAHVESITLAIDDATPGLSRADLRRYLGIVEREAERLGTLVDELLALARSETDQLQLTLAPVDVAAVVDEVYQALAPLARHERQVTLVRDVPCGLPPMLADRQRLVQVLLNLVRNAITYTPAGGIVSLMAQPAEPDHLVLAVADTGSGIAPADLDRIFERFYRADASRARASGGFGLGLAIVRELVEAMGGTITVESTLGEGSCFSVRLPIAGSMLSAGKGV